MAKYQLKDAIQRGGALLSAMGLLAGLAVTAFPAHVFADALNPLTERSLKLSSSSPGWSYKDGSGNATYAPPHSGANGQKTGNEFSFRMSTKTATVKAITFQYCTTPAGKCVAPGDNTVDASDLDPDNNVFTTAVGTGTIDLVEDSDQVTGDGTNFDGQLNVGSVIVTAGGNKYVVESIESDTSLTLTTTATETEEGIAFRYRTADTDSTSDLNIVEDGSQMISSGNWDTIKARPSKTPDREGSEGNFVLLRADADTDMSDPLPDWDDYSYAAFSNWTMEASNNETGTIEAGTATGRNNFITIKSANGEALSDKLDDNGHGDYFRIIFFGTDDNYITNPGSGSFFVRMNTYSSDTVLDESTLIDGGVTVANVMNESITIRTKVLETMDFSVGTYDPTLYTDSVLTARGLDPHGQCNTLLMANPLAPGVTNQAQYEAQEHNVIYMGDPTAEYSLATGKTYVAQSYWRLASNSSGGATVYYTGHTLTNTVGDEIAPLPESATSPQTGTEQFGLAIAHDSDTTIPELNGAEAYPVWLSAGESYGDYDGEADGDFLTFLFNNSDKGDIFAHKPRLYPLVPLAPYNQGAGDIEDDEDAFDPKFAFNANADTYAIPLATESDQVVNCVTAKMRYIANIAATTPAGIYTTKINYVAAPQY